MIYDELPCSWRWVDSQDKLTNNNDCLQCQIPTEVFATETVIPGFIFRSTNPFYLPNYFTLVSVPSGADIDMAAELPNIQTFYLNGYYYVVWKGATYGSPTLTAGTYYGEISDGLTTIYSENIEICSSENRCLQIQWTNSCDLAGIPYAYLNSGGEFKNVAIIKDGNFSNAEYETEKDEYVNGLRQIHTFYKGQQRILKINHSGSEWYVRMMQAMQLHDQINFQTQITDSNTVGVYYTTGEDVQSVEVITSELEADCKQKIEIRIKQDEQIVGTNCCITNEPTACLDSCYDVDGFVSEFSPDFELGHYYIDDIDSGIIKQYTGRDGLVIVSTGCTYVHDITDDVYYFFDGDTWNITPSINSIIRNSFIGGVSTFTITGYTMPNTWVYLYWSSASGSGPWNDTLYGNTQRIPITSVQLAAGYQFQLLGDITFWFYIESVNGTCTYGQAADRFNP